MIDDLRDVLNEDISKKCMVRSGVDGKMTYF